MNKRRKHYAAKGSRKSVSPPLLYVRYFWGAGVGRHDWSIITGTNPSPRWQLPFGCLIIALGIHVILYRNEASEMFQDQYDSFWKGVPGTSFYYDPGLVAGMGVVCCFIGGVGVVKGILG